MKVLVIDHDPTRASAYRRMLDDHEVTFETDSAAAIARFVDGARFDIVVCDAKLPAALDVLHTLRADWDPPRFIIASGFEHIVDDCFTADGVLIKPIRATELRSLIASLVEERTRSTTRRLRRPSRSSAPH